MCDTNDANDEYYIHQSREVNEEILDRNDPDWVQKMNQSDDD